ncbi:MAG TPA: STAS domain-containing protein [Aggregatilineales bacterium]|jgi:anti-anti-sigma factor|nr:STAS domain-containing protein [Aggregatilineales bacterium]
MVSVEVVDHGKSVLLVVQGRIDSMTAGQFGASVTRVIEAGHVRIALDLSLVDYMSSAGLRELVSAVKKLRKSAGDLRIARPSPRVREVMEMAGLDTIFLIFDTPGEAVDSF